MAYGKIDATGELHDVDKIEEGAKSLHAAQLCSGDEARSKEDEIAKKGVLVVKYTWPSDCNDPIE